VRNITEWLYLSDINHLVIREWLNGVWFALGICVVVVFLKRIVKIIYNNGGIRGFLKSPANRGAAALMMYFFGEALYRMWVWLLLLDQHLDLKFLDVADDFIAAILAALMATWAAFCIIYIYSRKISDMIWTAVVVLTFAAFESWIFTI